MPNQRRMQATGARPIRWHADEFDPTMASIRLRLFQPMKELRKRGFDVRLLTGEFPDDAVLIFSKSSSAQALSMAELAAARRQPIIYDICDNVFEKPSRDERDEARKERVRRLLKLATAVTCTTEPLAFLLAQEVPEIAGKTEIVPDPLEDSPGLAGPLSLLERLGMWRLRRFLRRHAGALHLVWFGKCKKGYAGIEHLGPVIDLLEALPLPRPVTLTVISNRRKIYRRSSAGWRVPKFYVPWSLSTFDAALRCHDVAIIPVDENNYTVGKTINRPATALMAGLGVIADPIPAYEELRPFIFLGDWEKGLVEYSRSSPGEDGRIGAAQRHLLHHYATEVVADRWIEVVSRLTPENLRRS